MNKKGLGEIGALWRQPCQMVVVDRECGEPGIWGSMDRGRQQTQTMRRAVDPLLISASHGLPKPYRHHHGHRLVL